MCVPELRSALAIAVVALLVVPGTATGQSTDIGATSFRPLGSFSHLHIPVAAGDAGKLNREFRKEITRSRLLPFGWRLLDALPSPPGEDVLVASVHRHPSIRGGVIVEFSDAQGRAIATVEGKPAPLRRTSTMSLINVLDALRRLQYETEKAERLISSFSTLRLRTASADALRDVAQRLREKGAWTVLDVSAPPDLANTMDVLDCSLQILNSIPSIVRLRCQDSSGRHVASVSSANCRSCLGSFQFSPGGDTKRAVDAIVGSLLDHRARVERIYSPQLRGLRYRKTTTRLSS